MMLRASDFCRRESSDSSTSSKQLPIQVQVFSNDLFAKALRDSTTNLQRANSVGINVNDIHNVALIGSPSDAEKILRKLSLLPGSLVVLKVRSVDSWNAEKEKDSCLRCVVMIMTCSLEVTPKDIQKCEGATSLPAVQISSTLAASLGCAWPISNNILPSCASPRGPPETTTIGQSRSAVFTAGFVESYFCSPAPIPSLHETTREPLVHASRVTLNCLGYPVPLATAQTLVWPRPPNGILISEMSVLQVQDPISHLDMYYEVAEIEPASSGNDEATFLADGTQTKTICFLTAPVTEYTFRNSSSTDKCRRVCRRLPPLPSSSPLHPNNNNIAQSGDCEYPHPDLLGVAQALQGISATRAAPWERVFPLVGSDSEHDVSRLVERTAHVLGMRCISVRGLAAFAAAQGHMVTTGSLSDQLEGLEMALNQAQKCAPCILHLVDLDLEFTSLRHESSLRDEQEHRVWSVIMDGLDTTIYHQNAASSFEQVLSADSSGATAINSGRMNYAEISHDESDRRWAPSLLVVISTTRSLSKTSSAGPLVQNLAYDAIPLSLPNADFAAFVWTEIDHERCSISHDTDDGTNHGFPLEDVKDLLAGRSVHDIQILHEQWCCSDHCSKSPPEQQKRFSLMCQEMDKQRRSQASSNSSSLVKIANVKWEDVGGLTQVRREIMDTIELPLRYPHFFPHGGRSGILLYGPPGTGKTLVAKAVATECNIPFLSVKGPELLGSYVGESEANVRGVFANARDAALSAGGSRDAASQQQSAEGQKSESPKACLVFFDELDSLAPRRDDTASGSGGGVMDRVVATLAAELDKGQQQNGSEKKKDEVCHIFVLGATNRPDLLDPALLRPGRFDRMVYLGVASTLEDRARILTAQIRHLKFEQGLSPLDVAESIVDHLPGNLTGADLSSIGSGALTRATQRLCEEADDEVRKRMKQIRLQTTQQGEQPEELSFDDEEEERAILDEVLSEWDETKLAPIVTIQDMLLASKDIIPSVSQAELERYEQLRLQFASS